MCEVRLAAASEHGVRVGRFRRHPLEDIPVLDDLAVSIETEDVDARPLTVIRPVLLAVEHHVVPFREDPPELDTLPRVLLSHSLEVLDERFLAVRDHGIVLGVGLARVEPYRFLGPALVEHQVVEGLDRLLVTLKGIHGLHSQAGSQVRPLER